LVISVVNSDKIKKLIFKQSFLKINLGFLHKC